VSTALRQRREQLATAARAAHAGLSPDEYRAALLAAAVAWGASRPWCWLPERVRDWAFVQFGRRLAARFVAAWKEPDHG
jgi:hypothetical protein